MELAWIENPADINGAFKVYRKSKKESDLARVVDASRKLIHHYIRLYSPTPDEDLVQVGMEGLLKAAARYEEKYGVSFVTYASNCIMGEIRHYIRKEAQYYRPGCIADLQCRIERFIEDALKEKGEPPAIDEIALKLNVREEGVVQAMRAGLVSLDEVDLKKIKNLRYETFRLPIEDRLVLEQAVNKLNEVQRRVIGMLFFRDMTQEQAAKKLGISQRKVSRVLHKSLEEMAADIEKDENA